MSFRSDDKMKAAFYSTSFDTVKYWQKVFTEENILLASEEELLEQIKKEPSLPIVTDYDSVAQSINRLLQDDIHIERLIILERQPNIKTGKVLIRRGVKAYGNSRMLTIHFQQLLKAVSEDKVWMYPELMQAMIEESETKTGLPDIELLGRLTDKEQETTLLILDGLSNDAISRRLGITTRTVKAHITSIFNKLHVNDRLALVILLRSQ